uniref:Glucuronosyltransferase n=1 Tax=Rhabditophanes sp. KR3021 TaxID=114890 RepID=A0AC35UCZ4_9BILA
MSYFLYLFMPLLIAPNIDGYKILVYNLKFAYSHYAYNSIIADTLAGAGHDVTVIQADLDLNVKHPGAQIAKTYNIPVENEIAELLTNNSMADLIWDLDGSSFAQLKAIENFMKAQHLHQLKIINDKELAKWILNEKFDFGYAEVYSMHMIGLFKAWNITKYATGTATTLIDYMYFFYGVPFSPSSMPNMLQASSPKMTYSERVINLLGYLFFKSFFYYNADHITGEKEINKMYGADTFILERDLGEAAFIFINTNPFFDFPHPKTEKMIAISGIGIPEVKKLDKYWDDILNLRNQTILLSFGSLAKSSKMPLILKQSIVTTVKKLPDITVIFKYEIEDDGLNKDVPNLILSKWVPQNDLINDPRLSLFILHCGLNSVHEIAFAKSDCPSLAIPIFGDQMRNAQLIKSNKIGAIMNKLDLSKPDIFAKYIIETMNNKEFKQNSKQLGNMLAKRPFSAKDLLINNIEFACEFGNLKQLDLESRHQGFIVYYMLDIIVPFILVLIGFMWCGIYLTIKFIQFSIIRRFKKYRPVSTENN